MEKKKTLSRLERNKLQQEGTRKSYLRSMGLLMLRIVGTELFRQFLEWLNIV